LIIESRKRKVEKAKEAEILLSMTQKLDQHWKTVIPIVKQLVNKDDEERTKPDDYDRMMKEMIFERRGEVSFLFEH
jgi:nucleolar protein 14